MHQWIGVDGEKKGGVDWFCLILVGAGGVGAAQGDM